jgi:hypothetical protein
VDFWDITKVMFRRWYIAVPLLLATLAATSYTSAAVKPDYVLTAYIQLIPPVSDGDTKTNNQHNPWLLLGLEALAQGANYATVDQTFLDELSSRGDSTNFSLVVGTPAGGATIEVVGKTREQTERTTAAILKRFQDTVESLQAQYNVKAADMITTHRLDQGENLKRPGGKVKRAIVVVAGAGLLLAAGLTIAIDALLRRRKRRKAESAASAVAMAGLLVHSPLPHNGSSTPPVRGGDTEVVPASGGQARPAEEELPAGATAVATEPSTRDDAVDQTALMPKLPLAADATIVLQLSRDQWNAGDNGGKRR